MFFKMTILIVVCLISMGSGEGLQHKVETLLLRSFDSADSVFPENIELSKVDYWRYTVSQVHGFLNKNSKTLALNQTKCDIII